jgi:acyl-CoA dehydrogenase
MNFDFPDEMKQMREQARRFLRERCPPAVARRVLEADGSYDRDLWREMARMGWAGASVPEEYGGAGLGHLAVCVLAEELGRAIAPVPFSSSVTLATEAILAYGSAAQKRRWLPPIAQGEVRLQAFAVTEPDSGSDMLGLATTAVREGDHYVINGRKIWTSRAEHSDLMLIIARTTPRAQAKTRTHGLSVFLIDMRLAHGSSMTLNPIRTMMNHSTTEIFLDDLSVAAENLIGEEGEGFRYILSGMNAERILIAAECIGDAKWFTARATGYARERRVFDRPIGQNQGVQFPIARAYAQMRAAELMVREAALRYQSGEECAAEANMAKLLAADASWAAAETCVQTHGGFGFAEDFDIERKFRETRLYQVAPISTNLILSYLAEHVLGLPRSY